MKTNPEPTDMASHENVTHTSESLLTSHQPNTKTGLVSFSISVVLHGLLFALLIFVQDFELSKPMPKVVQIDLVSFSPEPLLEDSPAPAEVKSKEEGISVKTPTIKKTKPKIVHKKPDISLKTKPKNLKKLVAQKKKKKAEPVKKEKAPPPKEELKAEAKESEPDSRTEPEEKAPEAEKIDEDQKRIAEALRRLEARLKDPKLGKDASGEGPVSRRGPKGSRPIDLYHIVLGSTIEQNWVFNDILARMDQNLEVRILIKILKSGEIRDIIYETRSGNRYLDESAKKAIKKANPLPELPRGYPYYNVVLKFSPRGVK